VIQEHLSDKVEILIHGRPDCVICTYVEDPKLFCEKCYCCKCQIPAVMCPIWEKHCLITKIGDVEVNKKTRKGKKTAVQKGGRNRVEKKTVVIEEATDGNAEKEITDDASKFKKFVFAILKQMM